MAGSAPLTAVLDANVLYPTLVRDLLLSLAQIGLYHARWTTDIENEWVRNLLADRPELASRLPDVVRLMREAAPDCLVENHRPLIDAIQLPDPGDRHVVAAAIAGHADAIVTFNLKHFPAETMALHGIEVLHPDDFVMYQLQLQPYAALEAIKGMRARWKNPPRSAEELISALEKRGLTMAAAHLGEVRGLI
ncbi:MAG: PIN domain-containing protein [Curvibacter sp.]|nr:PIN domain-containing protein [Curvibacter sp.]